MTNATGAGRARRERGRFERRVRGSVVCDVVARRQLAAARAGGCVYRRLPESIEVRSRRQAHLPRGVARSCVPTREGRRPVVVEHACVRKVGARRDYLCTGPCETAWARPTRRTGPRPRPRAGMVSSQGARALARAASASCGQRQRFINGDYEASHRLRAVAERP